MVLGAVIVCAALLMPAQSVAPAVPAAPAVPRSAQPSEQAGTFTLIKDLGPSILSFDKATFRVLGTSPPIFAFDIQIKFKVPAGNGEVKIDRFVNSLVMDCTADALLVVIGRGFSVQNEQVVLITEPAIFENTNTPNAPTTEVLKHFCPTVKELMNKTPPKKPTKQKPGERQA